MFSTVRRARRATLTIALAATAFAGTAHAAAAAPERVYVAATEVSIANRKEARAAAIGDALRAASTDEARFYDAAAQPVTMRVRIDKLGFKSGGKALAGSLPLVGMFAGANRNVMKGEVQLVDPASGKALKTFKIECDDDTSVSAADAALTYGKVGLSFLPFGSLIGSAMDVAEGAANKRDRAEKMLTRGFVMLSYRKVYGDKLYKSFSAQRQAAFRAAEAAAKAPAQSATLASSQSLSVSVANVAAR